LPPPAQTQLPFDGQRLLPGLIRFQWRGERTPTPGLTGYRLRLFPARTGATTAVIDLATGATNRIELDLAREAAFVHDSEWRWQVVSVGPHGESQPDAPPAQFRVDRDAPAQVLSPEPRLGPNGEIIVHSLRADAAPAYGELLKVTFTARDAEGTEFNGRDQMVVYAVPTWPDEEFTVAVRVFVREHPEGRIGQIFSAWSGAMDDPLRLVVDNGKLYARIEAGSGASTPGVPLPTNHWHAVAAVKRNGTLTLYLNGRAAGTCPAPMLSNTQARDCALGGNPHYSGNEFLAARVADFRFYGRALVPDEVAALAITK
jgi:hypothetical protein